MLLTAITGSNILAIEALANPIINWLVSAQPILATLLVFAVGIYLGNIAFNLITKSGTYQSRLLGQAARLAVIALFATVALQQIWTAKDIVKGASGQAEVAISQNHRTNVFLGKTNVSLGGGGYVTGIYFHPLQQDLIYIKTDIGGFYRWNPVDKSWLPLTDHFPLDMNNYYGGEALALDPNNPKVIINDSGDPNGRGRAYELERFADARSRGGYAYVATDHAPPNYQAVNPAYDPAQGEIPALTRYFEDRFPGFGARVDGANNAGETGGTGGRPGAGGASPSLVASPLEGLRQADRDALFRAI